MSHEVSESPTTAKLMMSGVGLGLGVTLGVGVADEGAVAAGFGADCAAGKAHPASESTIASTTNRFTTYSRKCKKPRVPGLHCDHYYCVDCSRSNLVPYPR